MFCEQEGRRDMVEQVVKLNSLSALENVLVQI